MSEQLKIAPPTRFDAPSINAFARELNVRLGRVAEVLETLRTSFKLHGDLDADNHRLTNVKFAQSDDDAMPLGQLASALEALDDDLTSEGEEEGLGGGKKGKRGTSRGRRIIDDEIAQSMLDAVATVAPPNVGAASGVGSTNDPPIFALSDHTHGGTLGGPPAGAAAGQIAVFTSTFEVGGSAALTYIAATGVLTMASTIGGDIVNEVDHAVNVPSIFFQRKMGGGAALSTNKVIGAFWFRGWDGTAYQASTASILGVTAEAFATGAHGTHLTMWTAPIGSILQAERLRVNDDGEVGIGTTVKSGSKLTVAGVAQGTQLKSTIAPGTAPLIVASTTLVANLNADLLDGLDATAFVLAAGAVSGSGAAGQVAFWSAASVLTGENALFWDATNDRLGVGTALPASDLHVQKDLQTSIKSTTFVSSSSGPLLTFEKSRGTAASPIAVAASDQLSDFTFGRGQFSTTPGDMATTFRVLTEAAEAFTSIARGTTSRWFNTRIGETTAKEILRLASSGWVAVGDAGVAPLGTLHVQWNVAGANSAIVVQHPDNTSGASHAVLKLRLGGTSGGDAFVWLNGTGNDWAIGLDNSDGDKFKISRGSVLGTTDALTVDTAGVIAAGSLLYDPSTNFLSLGVTTTPVAFFQIAWETATTTGIQVEKFGAAAGPVVHFRQARGTQTSPTASQLNDTLGAFNFSGRGATAALDQATKAKWNVGAAEIWTDTASGTWMSWEVTPIGSVTRAGRMRLTSVGLGLGPNIDATELLHVSLATAGATVTSLLAHTETANANSHAHFLVQVGGASGGDPSIAFSVSGILTYAWGIDNSDADKFELCRSSLIGTNVVMAVDTTSHFHLGGATPAARLHVTETVTSAEVHRFELSLAGSNVVHKLFQNNVATTDASVATLFTHTIAASQIYKLEAHVSARRTGGASGTAEDSAVYVIRAAVKNVAGVATLIGAVAAEFTREDQAAWDATIDVTGATARVRVTGAAGNNIQWHVNLFVMHLST